MCGTPLSHHVEQTLFRDSKDGEGLITNPRSILWMRVEMEEVPWFDILLKSKVQLYHAFDKWAAGIMSNPNTTKMLNKQHLEGPDLARTLSINRKPLEWEFLISG